MPDPIKIPSPNDILGNNSIPSPSDILGDSEKKKSTSTSTPQKSGSGTPTGSSAGVNPAFKSSIPSPIPDFNSMESVKSVVEKPKYPESENGIEPTFLENVVSTVKSKINKLATGSAQLGADYASTPELLYDAFSMPQNAIADYFNIPSLRADSEKFKKNIGVRNAVKEHYQGEVIKLREHAKQVDTQYQDGIYDSFKNGDILGGFDQLTNSFSESLAATSSIMMGGAFAKAPQLLATSSMVFGAGKNEQLKDENPDMKTNARVVNALATGLAEGAFETIGSGSIGAAARGIIEREGAKKGAIILKDGLTNIYKATIAKNPLLASMGVEGGTEWATKVTQNSIDVATGVKPQDFNVFDGATDALIGGIFGGAVFGAGLKGLENVANSKDKSTIKSNVDKTFELQKALENPDISESAKVELEKGIEKLVKTNQDLVKKNVEHADNLHPKVKEKLIEAVTKSDEIKEAVKAITLDNGTNDAQKQILLDGLKDDFKKHIQLKGEILDGKTTPVDVLPLKEQDKIKRQALKELTAEQNPDGTKSIEIDNAQIVERANKIYKAKEELEVQAEKVSTPPVEDVVAPSVEEVKPINQLGSSANVYFESEKYRVNDDTKNGKILLNIGDAKGEIPLANIEFDNPKEAVFVAEKLQENAPEGLISSYHNIDNIIKGYKEEYATQAQGDIVIDGNVPIGNDNVGESGIAEQESPAKEGVSKPVDGGEGEGDASVGEDFNEDDIANFLNGEFGAKKPVETPKAEVVKPKKEVVLKQEKVAQAKGFVSLAVNKLTTSLKDFQGRAKEYSQQTYDRIVNEAKEGKLNISSIPPIQIWNNPDTGKFVILAGHSRTKAFADLADGKVAFSEKYKKSDFTNVNAQIVEAETLEEAQKIAKESNQGAVQTVVDNAKYVRESLLPTFSNKNQAKTKLRALYGASWARIYAYANLNPKGKAMQMLKQFENANEGTSDDSSKRIAEWTGKARSDFEQLTDAHENEIFDHLLKNDKVKTYEEFSHLLNNRVNGLEQFDANEPLNFESKVGRGSNEVEVLKEIQDFKNREAEIKKSIKKLQANGKQITDSQRQEIRNLTAEAIKINTVDIPNAQKKQKQAKEADANQFDIFSQINEQIENGNITPEQVDEFVNDDRKAAEIEPIVEAIEIKAKSDKKAELEEVVADVEAVVVNKQKLTDSERKVRNHKDRIYKNPKDGYYYEVTGYNSGYFTIKDSETGKVSKEKEVDFENNFIDVTNEVAKQNAGITSESSAIQNGSNFDITQYEDNIFEVKDGYNKNAPAYKVVVGNAFDLDSSIITKDGKPLRKNERLPQGALIAIQNHVERFNPESKVREINKFLGRESNKPIPVMAEDIKKPKPVKIEVADNENVPTEYHENFKKDFPNTLLAIEEKNGMITIFEDGKSREIEGHKFFDELKQAIANGYKGIGKVTRKAVETESKKLLANAKIDKVAKVIKKATKADINPDDYHNNGFAGNQDKLIDLIADAAKKLVSAKIDLDEAIRQVIDSIKAKFGDFDVNIDEIKERINPKKEVEPKNPESKESSKDMEDFRDSWNLEPSSDEVNQYDSGRTIKREHGELRNNQDYEVQKDYARVQIGIRAIEHAKRLFGAEYVEKTLSFIEQANLSPEKKAVAYVLLENEMDARVKEFSKNVGVQKLQDLVRAKSQEFLANSARAMGAGRFRIERFRELAKNGFSEEEFTNAILTTKQINDKAKIQKLIQVSPDDINNESENQESDEDFVIEEPTVKRNKEAVKKDISAVLAQMRKDLLKVAKGNVAMSSIPYAAQLQAVAPHIIKLSKLLAELGGMTTKQIVNEVYNDIKEVFPGINKTDVSDILKEHSVKKAKPKTEAQVKQDSVKEIVKKALIEKGFSREITVTKNERDAAGKLVKDADGRNVKIKEKRTVLDWKKLAGEAGTISNIRKNVEESLKGSKYSKSEISEMKKALEREYVSLTSDVIEKGLNELQNRNAERKPVNTKSAAKKLAELFNYGLFEKNKDSYEKIINSVLGFNGLDQNAFDEMKEIARGYAVLMDSGLSDTEIKSAVNSLSRRQSRLVATLAFSQADWKFKLAVALSEITNLSTRFKLVNLGNLAENVSSGMMARAANNMMDAMANIASGKKTSNKAIKAQSKINARAKLRGITLETAESYGDTSSLLLNHSAVEDYFNNATTNKAYHLLISTYMAKPVLEGADSYNKILITEAKMVRATIKVLEAKGMSNSDALDYVAKAITGESMQEALVKAKALIEKVNEDAGRKLLNDSESSIKSLAADIVKESLVSGGQLSETDLKAIYNAAYKSAGKDIGHVSNNWVTDWISSKGAQIEKRVTDAIQEKKWDVASGEVVNQLFWKNFVSTFVGGGTNWFVKGLQKSSNPLSLFSLREDISRLKMAGKLDVTTDEGIKNMEESLYRGMNLRSTSGTMLMGFIITTSIISALSASGADDEIAKWLKENQWAKKFFDKMVPDAVVLMLAIKDKDFGRYIAKMINVKADFFDDQKNIGKILETYAKGYMENDAVKISDASGDLGVMLGKRFEFPVPFRAAKDVKQIYKGVVKGEYDKTNYYTSGFLNGFFQGGMAEGLGLRKDPTFQEQPKKGAFSPPKMKQPDFKLPKF